MKGAPVTRVVGLALGDLVRCVELDGKTLQVTGGGERRGSRAAMQGRTEGVREGRDGSGVGQVSLKIVIRGKQPGWDKCHRRYIRRKRPCAMETDDKLGRTRGK